MVDFWWEYNDTFNRDGSRSIVVKSSNSKKKKKVIMHYKSDDAETIEKAQKLISTLYAKNI